MDFVFCFALRRRMGGFFYLFLVVKTERWPTYLTYVVTTNQHIYPSATHSRQFFYHPRFFVYIHFADFFSHSPRKRCGSFHSYKCGGQIPFSCVCSAPSLLLAYNLFFSFFALGRNNRVAADCYSARFVGEESYSKGQSKKYLIPDVGPSWCIDPCKLRTEQK